MNLTQVRSRKAGVAVQEDMGNRIDLEIYSIGSTSFSPSPYQNIDWESVRELGELLIHLSESHLGVKNNGGKTSD